MSDLEFVKAAAPVSIARLAGTARLPRDVDQGRALRAVATIGCAGSHDLTVFLAGDDPADLAASRAGACFVAQRHLDLVPHDTVAIVSEDPLSSLRHAMALLYPDATVTGPIFARRGIDPAAIVHGDAVLERDVTVDPGAIIGPRVEVGAGTTIGANAVIGAGVRIGRRCVIDTHTSICAALIGDRVVIHSGARIGLGSRIGPDLGRVVVQDDVEIGANAVIERGRLGDTVIGERATIGALAVIPSDALVDRENVR